MEWDEVSYCAPESFFDPRLEAMDTFPKNLFTDVTGVVDCDVTEPRDGDSLWRTEDDDFRDLLEDTVLREGSLPSVLSSEEIFSQIEICSDLLQDKVVNSSLSDISTFDVNPSSPAIKQESTEEIDLNLEKVECDIAKLKQEVDFTSDDDSMWSDFFSEDDPSEISKEYDELLKYLLTQPVDDFDLTLNVFNNVEEEENRLDDEVVAPKVEAMSRETCLEHIMADHSYTLPFHESTSSSVLLTPPNSSDDSEPESDLSSQPSPRKISVKSDSSKYTHKTVKLKHKKDLKFVFSIKVKDSASEGSPGAGRSLLKKNHIQSFNSSQQLVREVLQKRAYRQRHKLNEAALAVQSLLGQENRDSFQQDRLLKMQTEREIHNSMERQRRIELKNELDKLKSLIPEIAESEKVSKLNVLNYSADYVKRLEKTDLKLKMKISYLREKRQRLTDQLNRLKSY